MDYCQKVKSVNYTFKYGDGSISAPSADADGVYRVDYTSEEQSYTVECVPVYTNYTIEDGFAQTISGKFTAAFGYGESVSFSEISMQAGLFDSGITEGSVTTAAQEFIDLVTLASKTGNYNGCGGMVANAKSMHDKLSESEKAHSRVVNAKSALEYLSEGLSDGKMDQEDLDGTQAILNNYVPPVPSGVFNGNVQIQSDDELLRAANACNNAGTGIMEYTITFTGVYSTETFVFKLGYTESSVKAARNMTVSLPSVLF